MTEYPVDSPFLPGDALVGPIIRQIAAIIRQQVAGVSIVYETPPDAPPEHNGVLLALSGFRIISDTNGKLLVSVRVGVRHMIRRASFDENIAEAYAYIMPYLQAFSAWRNQTLNGLARQVTPTHGGVTQLVASGQTFVCLIVNLDVLTEFNIPTS
ncbi:hypothetical protein EI42_03156 [Thermosporothrix hazakensis]|jgi:hypothetical protein|uniref:Gp37 protein n=1 Tax=Thermosporothrix hazakensis TaxID=644383 RepID=A0A326U561_THEHA|nr:hypothetical protein [Thermosporothrix hazakensis]PZW28402.1 hypothetical protein EI42_03156 [Thermosporothrix hazakensis]GCE45182.1 hypothetical protein KTH_00510 [Thermosporothrix hazakensis]